jgi:hypothetical protein
MLMIGHGNRIPGMRTVDICMACKQIGCDAMVLYTGIKSNGFILRDGGRIFI